MTKTNYINIVKKGGFYTVYNNDCYIINYLFNYKIVNNKTGFPISSINKVLNTLNRKKINYIIDNKEVKFNTNNYEQYLTTGVNNYNLINKKKTLEEKINKLSTKQIDELYNLIMRYLND